ncbi:MAG TPA: DUF488 domain-containing protein [Gammaproteobacteria bacterium]|nr:DUF488 domain-containing protein [Gammaproteobacteria bacterium]
MSKQGESELFTIGHSTHTVDYFIDLLKKHSITAVCDVRSHPYSKYNPQFNREVLKEELKRNNIAYVFLGKELGARSENPNCYIDGRVQYNYLVDEPSFQQGIIRLKKGMKQYSIALMCAEKDPITCHRTILVCREMRSHTKQIKHILANGEIETNLEAEERLLTTLGIVPDMFKNKNECIEEAYDKQGQKIAYVEEEKQVTTG